MKGSTLVRLFLILLVTGIITSLSAQQLRSFSGDSTRFIGELNQLFSVLGKNDRKIVDGAMIPFMQRWESEYYGPAEKRMIYSICNLMLQKRMRAFPDFYHYLMTLNAFSEAQLSGQMFAEWSAILNYLAGEKYTRHYLSFVEFSNHLFGENKIYQSSSTSWKLVTPNFRFLLDSVPFVEVRPTDIICYSNRDSLTIYQTRGLYYPLETKWYGQGGKVDWQRAGLDPAKVFANLGPYQIQMKFSKYEVDSVEFYNEEYFSSPLNGRLIDKVQADVDEEKASYPRFYSYENLIGIRDIFENVDYIGGFSMEGQKVVGFGVEDRDAELIFRRDNQEFVTARSRTFIIRPDRINSANASVTIQFGQDSIYHPGLVLKYLDENRELSLNKDERMAVISPWFDTYHNIEIYCEALFWRLSEPKIRFEAMVGPGTASKAIFESSNYYSLERYEKLQGIDVLNPLQIIKTFTERRNSREFTLNELVEYWRMPPAQVESQLLLLGVRGFLIYDMDDKKAVVKDKLIHYVNASQGKTDYDEIFFASDVEGKSNAVLNLENFDLKLQGVPGIFLSDTQHVYIEPHNQEIILKENRDFLFSGKIEAGLFDFYADSCSFDYEKFRLNMPAIDSLEFYVISRKIDPKTGRYPMKKVQTALNDLSGFLLIDDPENKAGLKDFPEYPVFTNKDTARVNWDKPFIYRGVYDKERFYFDVFPFTLASLDYIDTDSLQFDGQLISAGIFPVIPEPLKVRPDFSLGFEKYTDANGYPAYGGKGTFVSKVDLSNQGFRGDGQLYYLNSATVSDQFIFFPDSMKTLALGFKATEQIAAVEYPTVTADSVTEFWLPYKDSMNITSTVRDMAMYHDVSLFDGTLGLTPAGLNGSGTMKVEDAEMDSKGFNFKQHTFDALIADFRIRAYDLNELAISTQNYRTHFDFDERRGEFRSNLGISRMEFPVNQYVCSMDRFDWMIDDEEIVLTNEENQKYTIPDNLSLSQLIDVGYTGTEFISVHPKQDSLRFFALRARFNIRKNVINAEEVKIIKVADAAIYTDSGKVEILPQAVMRPLTHANIIANTTTREHNFYDATIQVLGRKKYTASGIYDYTDRTGEHQQILFSRISVDTAGHTVGAGQIFESDGFMLSPEFAFTGNVSLDAPVKTLKFTGAFKPVVECHNLGTNWVKFSSRINPDNVRLPVSDPPQNRNSDKILLGMVYSNTENVIYPAFFTPRRSFSDTIMIAATGMMDYRIPVSTFRVRTEENPGEPGKSGSSVSLNTFNCMMRSEGKINLGLNSGPMKMESFGTMDYYILPDSSSFRLSMILDFPFEDGVMERIRARITSTNLPGIQLFNSPYQHLFSELVDAKEGEKLKSELETIGRFRRFPQELAKTILIADVKMSYDTLTRSFVSTGQIGIASIKEEMVNRYLNGKIEMTRKRNGDEFTFYLEISSTDWYFFNYRNNVLQFLSSDLDLNDKIREAQLNRNEQKRLDKIWRGYRYTLSTDRKKRDFIRRFELGDE
ncbi:MAG: hypothetical protein D4R67_13555 [Bacteroidetes bacterium]|nr:MAG: hypothetical protein D4R67_13555 [Bacteroidota bacterium]